jgi:hypothetical protein
MYQYENIFILLSRFFSFSSGIQKQERLCFYESYKRLIIRRKYQSPPLLKENNRLIIKTLISPDSFSPG